jgi:phospholipid/cholesterol/gamma-HCH transport system permease protein
LPGKAWIKSAYKEDALLLHFGGNWQALYINQIEPILKSLNLSRIEYCHINLAAIKAIDTTGVCRIKAFLKQLEEEHISFECIDKTKDFKNLEDQLESFNITLTETLPKQNSILTWLKGLGQMAIAMIENIIDIIAFLGHVALTLGHTIKNPRRIRITSFMVFLERSGLQALPIVGIISFLIGIVLVHQGAFQLKRFGAEIYAVDLLAVSMLREVGILLTAIVVAGRSGSAFAAQIGTMKLNQEIEVMKTLGLNPIEILVLPRLFALMIALPLLAFYADIMGLLGGGFIATFVIGLSFDHFLTQLQQAFSLWSFWIGIIKAPVFAFIIALIGCYEGLQVSQGAESVGLRTTQAVVRGIFLVIIFNAAFSVLFTYIGI